MKRLCDSFLGFPTVETVGYGMYWMLDKEMSYKRAMATEGEEGHAVWTTYISIRDKFVALKPLTEKNYFCDKLTYIETNHTIV